MKVLKIAAIVVGAVALVATGIGAAGGFGLLAGVSQLAGLAGLSGIGASVFAGVLAGAALFDVASLANLILPKPSQGGAQTKWKADPYAGLPYVMGRTLVAGNIIYRRGSGGTNDYEQFVTVLGVGPFNAIETTFLNKTTVAFGGDGSAQGTYNGQVWMRSQLGACPEPAALTPGAGAAPGWTAQHKLSGMAATFLSLKYDTKSKVQLTTEPTPGWIVEGCKVWDPRLDSTYPGGSGPCRADQPGTHVYSEDPHLHGLKWAIGAWQNGVRVAGIGVGDNVAGAVVRGVDVAAFVEGANLNLVRNWKIGGQVVTRPDTLWNSLKAMLQAGGATPVINGGIISCVNRAPRVSLATITRSDIVGKCTLAGTAKRRARINGIIPQYRSEAHDWEMVSADEVSIAAYVAIDGDERTKEVPYPLVQQVAQVAQLAAYDICDAREAGPGSIPLKPWWLNYRIGDCVTFSPEDGFSLKVQITGRGIEAQSGVVTYEVRGETDGKHALALGATTTAPPIASLVYDTSVPTPTTTEWALTGTSIAINGNAVPALQLTGATTNPSVEAIIVEVGQIPALQNNDGQIIRNDDGEPLLSGDGSGWTADSTLPPNTASRIITGVVATGVYEVAVSYQVRGVVGERLVLGPVVAGQIAIAGVSTTRASYRVISQSTPYPITSTADTISIASYTVVIDDGQQINMPAGSMSGLAGGTTYAVFYVPSQPGAFENEDGSIEQNEDGSTSTPEQTPGGFIAAAQPAIAAMASSANIFLGWCTTAMADGSYPTSPGAPPGYGGAGASGNFGQTMEN